MHLSKKHVLKILKSYENDPQQLIAVLLDIQAASGINCVEKQWAELTSTVLNVPLSKIFDVLTFYSMFSTVPRGEYVIEICSNSPCYFLGISCQGQRDVVKWFETAAGIMMGETTADRKLSLFFTSCIGACGIGPVAKIGDDVFGNLTEDKVKTLIKYCREGKDRELLLLCQN